MPNRPEIQENLVEQLLEKKRYLPKPPKQCRIKAGFRLHANRMQRNDKLQQATLSFKVYGFCRFGKLRKLILPMTFKYQSDRTTAELNSPKGMDSFSTVQEGSGTVLHTVRQYPFGAGHSVR